MVLLLALSSASAPRPENCECANAAPDAGKRRRQVIRRDAILPNESKKGRFLTAEERVSQLFFRPYGACSCSALQPHCGLYSFAALRWQSVQLLFRPYGACSSLGLTPKAYAVGFIPSPLRGWDARIPQFLPTAYASRLGIAGSGQRTAEGGRPHVSIVPQQSLQVPNARIVILERSGVRSE